MNQTTHAETAEVSACSCGLPVEDCEANKAVQAEIDADQIAWWLGQGHAVDSRRTATGWTHTPVTGSWAMYQPIPGKDLFEATGAHGIWELHHDPEDLARIVLADCAHDQPDWVVNVYDPDEKLAAWAEWDNATAVSYRATVKAKVAAR